MRAGNSEADLKAWKSSYEPHMLFPMIKWFLTLDLFRHSLSLVDAATSCMAVVTIHHSLSLTLTAGVGGNK